MIPKLRAYDRRYIELLQLEIYERVCIKPGGRCEVYCIIASLNFDITEGGGFRNTNRLIEADSSAPRRKLSIAFYNFEAYKRLGVI